SDRPKKEYCADRYEKMRGICPIDVPGRAPDDTFTRPHFMRVLGARLGPSSRGRSLRIDQSGEINAIAHLYLDPAFRAGKAKPRAKGALQLHDHLARLLMHKQISGPPNATSEVSGHGIAGIQL